MVWLAMLGVVGTSWACPTVNPQRTVCASGCSHTTIAAAVSAAANNDVICVQPGTYTQQIVLSGKRVRIESDANGVVVNTGANGEIVRVDAGGDLELVGLDINGNTSRRCIYVVGAGSSIQLDGVDLANCKQAIDGAAIFLDASTSASIRDSSLVDNGGTGNGGTLYANGASSLDVIRSTVDGSRGGTGGAFYLSATDTELDGVDFIDSASTVGRGGGIYATSSPLTILGGSFTLSSNEDEGGALALEGSSSLTVSGTLFEDCTAWGSGGAVYHVASGAVNIDSATFRSNDGDANSNLTGSGGALYVTTASSVLVTDTRFEDNFSNQGGAVYASGIGNVDILRSQFLENDTTSDGGGAYFSGLANTSVLANNIFQANTCDDDGGALHSLNGSPTVRNNVFVENDCPGANHVGDGAYFDGGGTVLKNNVFAEHIDEGARKAGGGSVTSSYNSWYSNGADVTGFSKGTGELSADPLFYDYTANGTPDDIFVPDTSSPLIDAADPAVSFNDLDGTRGDIGAYGGPDGPDLDADGDGSLWPFDCDDEDPAAAPGGVEVAADGSDGDCNGTESCYQDVDNDGYGSATVVQSFEFDCIGASVSPFNTDCAPNNLSRYPGAVETVANGVDENCDNLEVCYRDLDDDNFGTSATVNDADLNCTDDAFQSNVSNDCNDSNATAYPGAVETPANGVDQSCDGLEACYQDNDNDDYGSSTLVTSSSLTCTGAGISAVSTDCADNNVARHPSAAELPANGVDEDCSGGDSCYADTDADTYGHPTNTVISGDLDCADAGEAANNADCSPSNGGIHPAATELVANGIDEDCNSGDTCYQDFDSDGVAGTTHLLVSTDLDCTDPGEFTSGTDCDDTDADRWPGQAEVAGNGIDEDCDSVESCYDDDDADTYGDVLQDSADLDCTDPGETHRGGDCDDTRATVYPAATEVTANGIDQDCDGFERCYQDLDGDTYGRATTTLSTTLSCNGSGVADDNLDCNDGSSNTFPGAPEVVDDGQDQDCSGSDTVTCYEDLDQDGYGTDPLLAEDGACDLSANESEVGNDCDDTNLTIHPLAAEVRADGIDQDCDGTDLVDCYLDADNDGYGVAVIVPFSGDCGPADNKADNAGDCNDADDTVYPGAYDLCGDGIDMDCGGLDDEDGDGLGIVEEAAYGTSDCSTDTDEDGLTDPEELLAALDPLEPDTDGDGLLDGDESGAGTDPLNADTDGDSLLDGAELEQGTDPLSSDTDGDTLPDDEELSDHGTDPLSSDTDTDGLSDSDEIESSTDPLDEDSDDDLLPDGAEASEGTDPLDPDSDDDDLSDGDEVSTHGTDPTRADTDDDGLSDGDEVNVHDTDPLSSDTDSDGLSDSEELPLGTDPLNPDTDTDTLLDGAEISTHGTDPLNADTDGDSLSDGDEVQNGTDPLDPADPAPDADGDGFSSAEDCDDSDPNVYPGAPEDLSPVDRDCDGLSDPKAPFAPGCACSTPQTPSPWLALCAAGLLLRARRLSAPRSCPRPQ